MGYAQFHTCNILKVMNNSFACKYTSFRYLCNEFIMSTIVSILSRASSSKNRILVFDDWEGRG